MPILRSLINALSKSTEVEWLFPEPWRWVNDVVVSRNYSARLYTTDQGTERRIRVDVEFGGDIFCVM